MIVWDCSVGENRILHTEYYLNILILFEGVRNNKTFIFTRGEEYIPKTPNQYSRGLREEFKIHSYFIMIT